MKISINLTIQCHERTLACHFSYSCASFFVNETWFLFYPLRQGKYIIIIDIATIGLSFFYFERKIVTKYIRFLMTIHGHICVYIKVVSIIMPFRSLLWQIRFNIQKFDFLTIISIHVKESGQMWKWLSKSKQSHVATTVVHIRSAIEFVKTKSIQKKN